MYLQCTETFVEIKAIISKVIGSIVCSIRACAALFIQCPFTVSVTSQILQYKFVIDLLQLVISIHVYMNSIV